MTTIVVMGYTGLATVTTVKALTSGEPPLAVEQLGEAGTPRVLLYQFAYRNANRVLRALSGTGTWLSPR